MQPNVKSEEIAHFNQLRDQWWDPEGGLKTLHKVNPARLEFIQGFVSLNQATVLDVGCGGGILSEGLAKAGAQVTGLDLAKDLLSVASNHAESQRIKVQYECISIEEYANANPNTYDVITCMEMLEHVPQPASIIRACVQALKPGGWIFVSTLNRNLKSYLHAVIAAEYLLHLLPMHTHQYSKFIKPHECHRWLTQSGVDVTAISGLNYSPFTQKATLVKDTSVNYLMGGQKIR